MAKVKSFTPLLFISFLLLASCLSSSNGELFKPNVTIANGLEFGYYRFTCPQVDTLVRNYLTQVYRADPGQAAAILRLQSHDCFVQGCDGSVLLDRSPERSEIPNKHFKQQTFQIIETLRQIVHTHCGRVVSCSDLLTLAARDAVFLTGGPDFTVPLGRRDGVTFPRVNQTFEDLIAPTAKTTEILTKFARKGLNLLDTVALSGAHTIGIARCSSFRERLFPTRDPTMEISLYEKLRPYCAFPEFDSLTWLDFRSPFKFDNLYFVDLINRQGLFTSDQDLFEDPRTRGTVINFANNEFQFFASFAGALIKMGTVGVLTDGQGEIRARCNMRNSDFFNLESVLEKDKNSSSAAI
ncbi:peroxidase 12 [Manihot esculenta]|uniref:Peroxidase n=2 Tax=Manihot esculenta TaxID=3983 RepID=A0A2C9WF34_MANES|nr:peroxidase 12 [Manihot esculenta]KAG8660711.1 hypothetical protein MANES_02G184800v8 [Manihot esculenta]OAY58526.1 hypothetical protein MANES_02G184800v8 [Manihot esculenta]